MCGQKVKNMWPNEQKISEASNSLKHTPYQDKLNPCSRSVISLWLKAWNACAAYPQRDIPGLALPPCSYYVQGSMH